MEHKKRIMALLLALIVSLALLSGCATGSLPEPTRARAASGTSAITTAAPAVSAALDRDGAYRGKNDVALYIHMYGKLPGNFITKAEARALGWTGGPLGEYAPGRNIGGDRFGNYEGLLPARAGRVYYECDIGTTDTSPRGARRIVFSNDGLIYYTDDHYASFTKLYGGESP